MLPVWVPVMGGALPRATSPIALLVWLPLAMLQRLLLVLRPELMLELLLSLLSRHLQAQPPPLGWAGPTRSQTAIGTVPAAAGGPYLWAVLQVLCGPALPVPAARPPAHTDVYVIVPCAWQLLPGVVAVEAVQSAVTRSPRCISV